MIITQTSDISGFRHEEDKNYALLGC